MARCRLIGTGRAPIREGSAMARLAKTEGLTEEQSYMLDAVHDFGDPVGARGVIVPGHHRITAERRDRIEDAPVVRRN